MLWEMEKEDLTREESLKKEEAETSNSSWFIEDEFELLLAVSRVSAAISGLGNLDAILKIGLDTTLKTMKGASGGIMLLDEESGLLSYRVTSGLSERYSRGMYMRPGEGIAGKVLQSGKAILVDDISGESDVIRPDLVSMEGLRAFASVPLKVKEKVLGVMNCTSLEPHSFTHRDIHLLQSIGDQLGIAIEQARLHEKLRSSRERYRQMAHKIIVTQEEERKKLARDLHDETSQILAGLALNMQALIEIAESKGIKDEKFMDILRKSHDSTVQIHNEVSRMIANLRPTQLDTLGLAAAIRQYVHFNVSSRDIEVYCNMDDEVEKYLLPEEELSLFRWVQGAVGNIIQHAGARSIEVYVAREKNKLVFKISDDGKGFEFDRDLLSEMRERGRGYGLMNMKERITLIGGEFSIQSRPGEGTTVIAELPLMGRETVNKE